MTKQPAVTPATTIRTFDPEVQPASVRPSWTAAQKFALLAEYEAFPHGSAERGAFLRRNGLHVAYSNPLRVVAWSRGFSRIGPPKGSTPFHNQFRIAISQKTFMRGAHTAAMNMVADARLSAIGYRLFSHQPRSFPASFGESIDTFIN